MSFLYRCIFLHVTPYDEEIHNVLTSNIFFSIITDNVTCQTKCHVTIHNLYYSNEYKLGEVELRFGDEINKYEPCIPVCQNTLLVLSMYIACPAWNKGKYIQVTFLNFNNDNRYNFLTTIIMFVQFDHFPILKSLSSFRHFQTLVVVNIAHFPKYLLRIHIM